MTARICGSGLKEQRKDLGASGIAIGWRRGSGYAQGTGRGSGRGSRRTIAGFPGIAARI